MRWIPNHTAMILAVIILCTATLHTVGAAARLQPWQAQAIAVARQLGDRNSRPAAVAFISKKLQTDAHHNVGQLYMYWLEPLMKQHAYGLVESLAMQGILGDPGNTDAVDRLMFFRISALLKAGHDKQALRNAKSLFNVCTLYHTKIALTLLQQCLDKVYGHNPAILRRFISQQITGAKMPVADEPITRCGILAAITINAKAYQARLAQLKGTDNRTLSAKANVLLLAGKPRAALRCLREVAAMAGNRQQFILDESDVCRAIKAEDGTIGRANAHLLQTLRGKNYPF